MCSILILFITFHSFATLQNICMKISSAASFSCLFPSNELLSYFTPGLNPRDRLLSHYHMELLLLPYGIISIGQWDSFSRIGTQEQNWHVMENASTKLKGVLPDDSLGSVQHLWSGSSSCGVQITLCICSPHINTWNDLVFYPVQSVAWPQTEQLVSLQIQCFSFWISDGVSLGGPVCTVVLSLFSWGMFSLLSSFSIKFQLSPSSNKFHVWFQCCVCFLEGIKQVRQWKDTHLHPYWLITILFI